jgi:hypothetical protein
VPVRVPVGEQDVPGPSGDGPGESGELDQWGSGPKWSGMSKWSKLSVLKLCDAL